MAKFIEWMKMVRDRGLDQKTHILAGLIPIKSVGMARYMANNVSGLSVPKEIVNRMADAKDPKEEGVKICLETIEALKEVAGVHGIHIMAVAWEDIVPRIVEEAGLMPRPVV
jgi:methylenetetrahydrofolate reductase (NADPH)